MIGGVKTFAETAKGLPRNPLGIIALFIVLVYVLLDQLRKRDREAPFFIYAGSSAPEHKQETAKHLGQGCTNNAQELFQMVMRAVLTGTT